MTIDELTTVLAKQDCHLDTQMSRQWWVVLDQDQNIVGKISKDRQNVFTISHSITPAFLNKAFLHFAATPLRERIATCELTLTLSVHDWDLLSRLPIDQIDYHQKLLLSDEFLSALRHLRQQINPEAIKAIDFDQKTT